MFISQYRLAVSLCLALGCACAAGAQQEPPSSAPNSQSQDQSAQPIPAYHSPLASQADNGQASPDSSQQLTPDNNPLAGAQDLTLGSPETSRSYWQPHVDVIATADSNALGGNAGWTTYSTILGGIDLHQISGHSNLTLGYTGGAILSNDGSIGNSAIQQLNFAEKISGRRIVLSILDNMDYLPEATLGYGYGGGASLNLPGGGSLGFQPGLAPVDSILTTRGSRADNSFITQADLNISRRSSFTFLGGYSLLHYFDNSLNLLNFKTTLAQAGYNHQVSSKDSFAVFYRFSGIRYDNVNQTINDNLVQVSYARRVTGRLAFQIAAGPEYTLFSTPVLTGSSGTSTSTEQLNWSLSGYLNYQLERGGVSVSYFHGVSAGSGVFAGAESDTVTAQLSRRLTRTFTGGINGGDARNRALAIPGFQVFNQSYNYAFAGASLSHPWGRTMDLSLSYQAEYQTSSNTFCAGVTCGTSVLVNLISVGFNWHARPMLF